jgi:hypothetical protein
MSSFELPTHCVDCGAVLMGGATKHKPGCSIGRLIEKFTQDLLELRCKCEDGGVGSKDFCHRCGKPIRKGGVT